MVNSTQKNSQNSIQGAGREAGQKSVRADFQREGTKASVVTLVVNFCLCGIKLGAGLLAGSSALVSDGLNSASDVLSTLLVLLGILLSSKKSDQDHSYGHERIECVVSILLSVVIFLSGLAIGYNAIEKIQRGTESLAAPGLLAIVAAVVSIGAKVCLYFYCSKVGKRINSSVVMASAMDHRSDVIGTSGTLIAIVGARLGLAVLDPVASLLICLFICKTGVEIFKDATDRMVDKSCPPEKEAEIRKIILATEGVRRIDVLQTRLFGSRVFVDTEISADADLTLEKSHAIAEKVHVEIEASDPEIKHCMVHVNPYHGD